MNFSVIIPCHNAGRWIGEALRSVAAQTHSPHEIIVIDDDSTDDSIERIKASDVDVTLLHSTWHNGAGARNVGIGAASGDWVAFLDADDYWYPRHLERAVKLLADCDDVAYLAHFDQVDCEDRQEQRLRVWPIDEPTCGLSHQEFLDLFARNGVFGMSSVLVRRDRLDAIGRLDPTQTRRHDLDMWLRVIQNHRWSFDPVTAYAYRVDTPGAISRNVANREYFYLRALLKNREGYAGGVMNGMIRRAARRAMSAAFTDGGEEDRQRARLLAWPHLAMRDRALFASLRGTPWAFRVVNRLRRNAQKGSKLFLTN